MKGEYKMKDKEMFQSLKEKRLQENEQKYGAEAREKYGNEQVDASNRRLKNLSAEQWDRYVFLEEDILKRLENGVKNNISADSTDAEEIVKLHKEWLCFTLPNYAPQVHRGIAAMYVADERFTKYYDRNIEGCAKLLNEAVQQWV